MYMYLNEEYSQISFNDRIINESKRKINPIMERVNFLIIASSNVDEFIRGNHEGCKDAIREQLSDIELSFMEIQRILYSKGIKIVEPRELIDIDSDNEDELMKIFIKGYFPNLQVQAINGGLPVPYMQDGTEYIITTINNSDNDKMLVKLPSNELIRVKTKDGIYFVDSSKLILYFIKELYKGLDIKSSYNFRILKELESIDIEDSDDYVEYVKNMVKSRIDKSNIVLCYESDSIDGVKGLVDCDHIEYMYPSGYGFLSNLKDFVEVPDMYYEKFKGSTPEKFENGDIFKCISKKDILVHVPYESFEKSLIKLLEQAASDNKVESIKQTIYRVAKDSKVINALCKAAENGKNVTAMVELKAKTDEERNLSAIKTLRESGVNLVYGPIKYKTHAKICVISRREDDELSLYSVVSTGNFNETSAKIYEDFILFTKSKKRTSIGNDICNIFNYLGAARFSEYTSKLLTSPNSLKQGIICKIDECIHYVESNPKMRCEIRFKCNGFTSKEVADKIYEAADHGIKISMIVRGMCIVIPNENIKIKSVIGRFLEHSRIYEFICGDDTTIYIGSADMMPRNLDYRVEVIAPIEDDELKKKLHNILDAYDMDVIGSYQLSDGEYDTPPDNDNIFSIQRYLSKISKERDDNDDE